MKRKNLPIIILILVISFAVIISGYASADTVKRDWLWPVPDSNRLSSCFGDNRNHNAIDIAAPQGTTIIASMSGTIVKTYSDCKYNYAKSTNCPCGECLNLGNAVYIEHTYGGRTYISRYGHLTDVYVTVGQRVSAGQAIGTVGSTGRSTGFHLDFQIYEGTLNAKVKYIDPLRSPFLYPPVGFNANAASTSCCYEYVEEVYEILNNESDYISSCQVTRCENTIGIASVSTDIISQPCSKDVFPYSVNMGSLSKNEDFTVVESVLNSIGETWLYIETISGTRGYIPASKVQIIEMIPGYARATLSTAVTAYTSPDRSSQKAESYFSGDIMIIKGSINTPSSGNWYITKNGSYVSISDLDDVNYTSSIKINGSPYPYNVLAEGKPYPISGTAVSDNYITAISAEIQNASGKTIMSKSVTVKTKAYSFKGSVIDNALTFGSLSSGTYSFILRITETATTVSGKTVTFDTVLKSIFSVGGKFTTDSITAIDSSGAEFKFTPGDSFSPLVKYDRITISDYNTPETIKFGSPFSIYGTLTSSETNMVKVTVTIKDSSNSTVISESAIPNSMTYSIGRLDNYVKFGTLGLGKYKYIITAENQSGIFTLISAPFTVVDNTQLLSSPGLENFRKSLEYNDKFSDVSKSTWYYQYVSTVYSIGIIRGTSENTYSPDKNLTIAECITLASKLHSIYYFGSADFKQTGTWYNVYVDYALKYGIIEQEFADYNVPASRALMAEIISKAMPEEALPAINDIPDSSIPDVSFSDTVYKLYRAGILNGIGSDHAFNPNSDIRRSEAAAIVSRMAVESLRVRFSM